MNTIKYKAFLNKISGNEEFIDYNDYLPIMEMILDEKELYITLRSNDVVMDKENELNSLFVDDKESNRANTYKKIQIDVISNRSVLKLKNIYDFKKSFYVQKEDIVEFYLMHYNYLKKLIEEVSLIDGDMEKEIDYYFFPFTINKFSNIPEIINSKNKDSYLKHLLFCMNYFEEKIHGLENPNKLVKKIKGE